VLVHWNNSPRVDMLLHSDTLFWFRAIQSLLFLLNTNLLLFGLTQPELDPTIYRTRGEHANHNATDVVSKLIKTVLFSNFFFSLQLTTRRKCIVAMYQQINERLLKTNYVTNNTMDNSWFMVFTQQFFSYIMARTNLFSMKWWWGPLCTRPTCLVGFL
jgi:hypothetical protein